MVRSEVVALDSSQLTVNTTWNPTNTGNTVTVIVSYPITPLVGWLVGNMTVSANSTMPISQ